MKFLKEHKDFDWSFDEEEFDNSEISVGDNVKVKDNYYYRSVDMKDGGLYKFEKANSNFVMSKNYIVAEVQQYRGIKMMKIRHNKREKTNWPWYICEYWEKI